MAKKLRLNFLKETFGSDVDLYQKLVTEIGAIGTLKAAADGVAYTKLMSSSVVKK